MFGDPRVGVLSKTHEPPQKTILRCGSNEDIMARAKDHASVPRGARHRITRTTEAPDYELLFGLEEEVDASTMEAGTRHPQNAAFGVTIIRAKADRRRVREQPHMIV